MSTYAHIANGVVTETIADTAMPLAQQRTAVFVAACVALTAEQAAAVQPGWTATETGGSWSFAAPAVAPGPTLAQQAQAALNAMDAPGGCAIRCFKAGVVFPATWQAYTMALRAIVNGTASPMPTALPTQPAYPAGT